MQRIDNAQIWEEIFTSKEWGKYPSISLVRFIASKFYKVRDQQQIRILEIGCGPGGNLWYMAREGFKVTGIDFSATARDLLQDRFLRDGLTGQLESFLIGNYQDELPKLEDEYFDAIVDVESLYCNSFEDSKEIIENCLRKVKKDGYLFSQTFTDTSWGFNSKEVGYHQVIPTEGPAANTGLCRFTSEEDIYRLYENEKCKIESVEKLELLLANRERISEWIIVAKKL